MEKLSVTANIRRDVVERVRAFQGRRSIKLFCDAFEAYIEHLESKACPKAAKYQ